PLRRRNGLDHTRSPVGEQESAGRRGREPLLDLLTLRIRQLTRGRNGGLVEMAGRLGLLAAFLLVASPEPSPRQSVAQSRLVRIVRKKALQRFRGPFVLIAGAFLSGGDEKRITIRPTAGDFLIESSKEARAQDILHPVALSALRIESGCLGAVLDGLCGDRH